MFITLDIKWKNRPKSFVHWKVCFFFQKTLFSTTSFVLKNWSYNDQSNCHTTLWTLTKCALRFVTLYSTSENRPKLFLHCKNCLYLKSLCFQQPLKHWRNDIIPSLTIVRLPSSLLETIPWGLSHSIIGGRIGQNLLFTGKFAFFSKKIVISTFQQPLRS